MEALAKTIADTYDLTREKLEKKYDELVTLPLYRTAAFRKYYLDSVMADSLGYASCENSRAATGGCSELCLACFNGEYPTALYEHGKDE